MRGDFLHEKKDGHVHTPFCPHGSDDSLEMYVERALNEGFEELTFTEHAPLPEGFNDPVPGSDSAMSRSKLEDYITRVTAVKKSFDGNIKINLGFEVDFIRGYEKGTERFLNDYGPYMDDGILSVHFLKPGTEYQCLDFDSDTFLKMAELAGGVRKLHELYYETLLAAVQSELGPYKPGRLGHLTLIKNSRKHFRLSLT